MNHQLAKIAGPTIITFALFLGGAAVHSQSGSPGRMLFTVWPGQTGKQPDSPILDPVALVTASGFDEPLKYGSAEGKEAEAIYDTFEKAYLNSGQKYPLLFGGSEIGGGRRRGSGRNKLRIINCDRKTIGSASQRAATSIQGLRLHTNWRQPNTTGQRSEFLNAAAAYLTKKGVTGVLPSAIKLRNLRLTKVRLDGPNALVGSITFKDSTTKRNLFLVLEQGETNWDVDMASYHVTKDLEDYVDEAEEDFVDQLDLDSDGVDEIVTISYYYESWDYAIYKEKDGKWEKVYKGGGGGC